MASRRYRNFAVTAVSIVVPAYNHVRYLEQAIDSVLSQSHADLELIVLDDGSTDGTRTLLERIGGRFRWESQENMGQAATLNKGWLASRGELIGYLSADDVLYPDCVKCAVEALDANLSLVATYCDFDLIDAESQKLGTVATPDWCYADMLLDGECPPGPGALFRRVAYKSAGGWNPAFRRVPDYEFWLRLGLQGQFCRIPQVLAGYRVHGGAQSFSSVDTARADEILSAVDMLLAAGDLPPSMRARGPTAKANALLHAARLHLLSGRWLQGFSRAGRAIAVDPFAMLRPRTYRRILGGLAGRLWRRLRWGIREN